MDTSGNQAKTVFIGMISGKGRGIFAARNLLKGELIETCPVVLLPARDAVYLDRTELTHYYFKWNPARDIAICLGYGSLYNHSPRPNAEWESDYEHQTILFKALRDIASGEEITHDYGWSRDDEATPQWFLDLDTSGRGQDPDGNSTPRQDLVCCLS